MRNLNLEMKTILAFLFLLFLFPAQRTDFEVLPTASYNSSVASAQACLANCQSCQTLTNQCEECYAPYFSKAQDGSCQLTSNYVVGIVRCSSNHPPTRCKLEMPSSLQPTPGGTSRRPTAGPTPNSSELSSECSDRSQQEQP